MSRPDATAKPTVDDMTDEPRVPGESMSPEPGGTDNNERAEAPSGAPADVPAPPPTPTGPTPTPTPTLPVPPTPTPSARPPWFRRTGVLMGASLVAVALVAGGIGYAVAPERASSTERSTEARSDQPTHQRFHRLPSTGHRLHGRIDSENGDTWTITSADGSSVAVIITPETRFGTTVDKQDRSQFGVGDRVAVRGEPSNDSNHSVTARWIAKMKKPEQ